MANQKPREKMTQKTDAHTPLYRFWLQPLLVQSLSWIGVLTFLSGNLVLAQTSPDANVLPKGEDSKPQAIAASESAPAPIRLEKLMQKLSSTSHPVPQVSKRETIPAPQVSVQQSSVVKLQINIPRQVQPNRVEKTAKSIAATDYSNAYIDPTRYNIGATSGYEAPSRVVLSERSTGCRAVLRQGQGVSGSLCGTRMRVAVRGIQSINTIRLSRPQAPRWASSRAAAITGVMPVRIGPLSLSKSDRTGKTLFQGRIAYNGTLRPTGQPANAHPGLMFPLTIPATITSIFGWRIHPITNNHSVHTGTDLGAPLGTPVVAADAGNVALADFLGGYGLTVVLDHKKFTQQTLYAHLSEIFVQPGEWVKQGTVIGRVGSTGNSTGPHLHFETRQLTPEGWVATDSGAELEYALAQLVDALRTAEIAQKPGA